MRRELTFFFGNLTSCCRKSSRSVDRVKFIKLYGSVYYSIHPGTHFKSYDSIFADQLYLGSLLTPGPNIVKVKSRKVLIEWGPICWTFKAYLSRTSAYPNWRYLNTLFNHLKWRNFWKAPQHIFHLVSLIFIPTHPNFSVCVATQSSVWMTVDHTLKC